MPHWGHVLLYAIGISRWTSETFQQRPLFSRDTCTTRLLGQVLVKTLKGGNYDYIFVIKDYMGVTTKKEQKKKSVNQEIFVQMRNKLNSALDEYNSRKEEDKKIKN